MGSVASVRAHGDSVPNDYSEAMNLSKEYRKAKGLTQGQLARELNEVFPAKSKYTTALISYIEKGLVDYPENVRQYLAYKIDEKAFRNRYDEVLGDRWVVMPPHQKKSLKTAILGKGDNMTQAERIIGYIHDFGSITTKEAFVDLGVTRLASRIFDLTEDGYEFDRKIEKGKNRYGDPVHYTRYSLRNGNGKENVDRQRYME